MIEITQLYWLYFLSIPILTRLIIINFFSIQMSDRLKEGELDRDSNRDHIKTFAGFSFTGLLGLIIVTSQLEQDFTISIILLFVSFLSFLTSLNIQGYKSIRFWDQIGTMITEIGTLALTLSLLSLMWQVDVNPSVRYPIAFFAIFLWIVDHIIRIYLYSNYLKLKGR